MSEEISDEVAQALELAANLGMDREELAERLVSRMLNTEYDEYDEEVRSSWSRRLGKAATHALEEATDKMAKESIEPAAQEMIRKLVLQPCDRWGVKKDLPTSFEEYMARMAEEWMSEEIDKNGKSKQNQGYGFKSVGRRIDVLVSGAIKKEVDERMQVLADTISEQLEKKLHDQIGGRISALVGEIKLEITK